MTVKTWFRSFQANCVVCLLFPKVVNEPCSVPLRSWEFGSQLTGLRNGTGWKCSGRNESVSFLRKTFCGPCLEWGQQEVRWCSVRGLAAFVYGRGGVSWSYFWRLWFHIEIFLAHPICNNYMICLGWHWLSTGCSLEPSEKRSVDWRVAWPTAMPVEGCLAYYLKEVLRQKVLAIKEC